MKISTDNLRPLSSIRRITPIHSKHGRVRFVTFHGLVDKLEHFAVLFGSPEEVDCPVARVHSECITGDIFRSKQCDCGEQLDEATNAFSASSGVLIYLRQEGRGIGLYNKMDAYELQAKGLDTYEANVRLGFPKDKRDYLVAAQMLSALGIQQVKLLSNNPEKKEALIRYGINVENMVSTKTYCNEHNFRYLMAKKNLTNHKLQEILL